MHRPGCKCEICKELHQIKRELRELIEFLKHQPTGISIQQLQGEFFMPITGVTPGGTNTFGEVPTPSGSAFPAGTTFTWSVDDTADISLTPSSSGTSVATACSATPTQTSFNLTCTSNYTPVGAQGPVAATVNVPILAVTPPTPTGMTINQLS
jgi:hypothetical protein